MNRQFDTSSPPVVFQAASHIPKLSLPPNEKLPKVNAWQDTIKTDGVSLHQQNIYQQDESMHQHSTADINSLLSEMDESDIPLVESPCIFNDDDYLSSIVSSSSATSSPVIQHRPLCRPVSSTSSDSIIVPFEQTPKRATFSGFSGDTSSITKSKFSLFISRLKKAATSEKLK